MAEPILSCPRGRHSTTRMIDVTYEHLEPADSRTAIKRAAETLGENAADAGA